MKGLLDQYTSKIKTDDRVFSQDVMSPDEFASPFDQWTRQTIEQTLKPEFLRYQYDPFKQQSMRSLQDLNQQQGASGAWRTAAAGRDMNTAIGATQRQEEQLWRQYNDQALQTMDAFKSGWSDPLYKKRMESFYEAPWRNQDVGAITPTTTPTDPRLQGFTGTPAVGSQQNTTPYIGSNGMYFGGYDPRSSLSQQYNLH